MQKEKMVLLITICFILIVVLFWLYLLELQPKPGSYIKSNTEDRVLVIDMNANTNPTLSEVFTGEDAILVVHLNSNPARHVNDIIYAGDIFLAIFDHNRDGRIDAHDKIYKNLQLKYFDKPKGGVSYYMPIAQAGIRAIFIDPYFYEKARLGRPHDLMPHKAGVAIMADGSSRLVKHMFVDDYYLKTEPTP